MAQLQSTNVTGVLSVNGVAVGGGKDFKYCCITTTGTWTPSSDLVDGDGVVQALIVGGGGQAGDIGSSQSQFSTDFRSGGGGGGEVREFMYPVTSSATHATTIGAGGCRAPFIYGPPANCDTKGPNGGDTSIDGPELCAARGGGGGFGLMNVSLYNLCCYPQDSDKNGGGRNQYGGGMNEAGMCTPVAHNYGFGYGANCSCIILECIMNQDFSGSYGQRAPRLANSFNRGYKALGSFMGAGGGSNVNYACSPEYIATDNCTGLCCTTSADQKAEPATCCGAGGSRMLTCNSGTCEVMAQGGGGGNGLIVLQWNE